MYSRSLIALAACSAAGVIAAPALRRGAELPYVQWVGSQSQHAPGFTLVRDEESWRDLWQEHTAADAGTTGRHFAPQVDFERCMVVAYFRGLATNEDGETVRAVDEADEHVRIRFVSDTFQTASFDGSGGTVRTSPFGIWVLPATTKAVVVEEGNAELKDRPLKWREVHRFGPQ
jgi:hypothetical protein